MHNSSGRDDEKILIYTIYDNNWYLSASTTLFIKGNFKIDSTNTIHSVHGVLGFTIPFIYKLTMKR